MSFGDVASPANHHIAARKPLKFFEVDQSIRDVASAAKHKICARKANAASHDVGARCAIDSF